MSLSAILFAFISTSPTTSCLIKAADSHSLSLSLSLSPVDSVVVRHFGPLVYKFPNNGTFP